MITFKTFLESKDRPPPKTISKEAFEALPAPDASNIDQKFRVGKVAFDNENGFGATPNNAEIAYFGFVIEMTPSQFLKQVTYEDRSEDAMRFVKFIEDHAPMASPMLYLKVNKEYFDVFTEPLRAVIQQHEGRGRMWAARAVNGADTKIPVHVIVNGGVRAKDLNTQFFDDLRKTGMVYQGGSEHAKPQPMEYGRIFWNGKTL
jgi:hypothetical protein